MPIPQLTLPKQPTTPPLPKAALRWHAAINASSDRRIVSKHSTTRWTNGSGYTRWAASCPPRPRPFMMKLMRIRLSLVRQGLLMIWIILLRMEERHVLLGRVDLRIGIGKS